MALQLSKSTPAGRPGVLKKSGLRLMKRSQLAELIQQESDRHEKSEPLGFHTQACRWRARYVRYASGVAGCRQLAFAVREGAGGVRAPSGFSCTAAVSCRCI